jgi:hypothetical protein
MAIFDGDRDKTALQAKPCVDTGTVVFARPWASGEWVVGSGVLLRVWTADEDTVHGVLSASSWIRANSLN